MIKQLAFFGNGNVWASDECGFQVPQEQEPAWLVVIREKLERGVINPDTIVMRSHYSTMTVGEILRYRAMSDSMLEENFQPGNGEEVNVLKNGKIDVAWKETEQLLPSEVASFRDGLRNLVSKFQRAGAQIETANFVSGGGETINLLTAPAHAGG
jgi:hypothetical protein